MENVSTSWVLHIRDIIDLKNFNDKIITHIIFKELYIAKYSYYIEIDWWKNHDIQLSHDFSYMSVLLDELRS